MGARIVAGTNFAGIVAQLTTQQKSKRLSTAARPRSPSHESDPDGFLRAREQLHEMEEHLRSGAAFADDHAALEKYVREHGREVERRTLQAHLNLRAARERSVDVRGADGVRRTTHRQWTRRLLTIVGMVEVKRRAYEAEGVDVLFPADAALNLPETCTRSACGAWSPRRRARFRSTKSSGRPGRSSASRWRSDRSRS